MKNDVGAFFFFKSYKLVNNIQHVRLRREFS